MIGRETHLGAPFFLIFNGLYGRYAVETMNKVGVAAVEIRKLVAMGQHDPLWVAVGSKENMIDFVMLQKFIRKLIRNQGSNLLHILL